MLKSNFFNKNLKKITKPKKNKNFWNHGYFIRTAYQLRSQSMSLPDKQKAARNSNLVGKKTNPTE